MTQDRRQKIEQLYSAARKQSPQERRQFLDQVCDDTDLRRQVEDMLARDSRETLAEETPVPQISVGSQLGPYKIEALIGAGGMGQVFRAIDTRLSRPVAIKTAHQRFSDRFTRETRAIAQLNHPHICTLYDVGPNYLVMELVEGETLSARIKKGALPFNLVLRFGAQIAQALGAAHAKMIIHRDLKPGNIMLAKTGVKVLDFGLAKMQQEDETLTAESAVMGTPAYMSPEQREGRSSDARADIYALGLVLQEMATGTRSGEMEKVPPQFAHIVQHCLENDPAERWQSALDIGKELEWLGSSPVIPARPAHSSSRPAWIVALAACAALLIAGILWLRRDVPVDIGASAFTISFENMDAGRFSGGFTDTPIPSPDGRFFVFRGKDPNGEDSLWLRPLQSLEAKRLPNTAEADGPLVWSPDGKWIAFYAGGKLKKISMTGGPAETIAELPGFQDAAWGADGDIIYRPTNRAGLFRVRDSGGTPQLLTTLNKALTENSHRFPQFLPGGRRFLFVSRCGVRANNALYIGSLDSPEVKRVMPAQAKVIYIPPINGRAGALLYYRDGAILGQQFDPKSESLAGNPVTVLSGVGYAPASILALFNASADGRVIIVGSAGSFDTRLVWFNRDGEEAGSLGSPGNYQQPRISPGGDRIAYHSPDPQTGNRDLYYIEIARGITHRLTTDVANDWFPVWSPDGRQLMFGSDRDGGTSMLAYLKTSMDPGSSESRFPAMDDQPYDWSRDGKWISGGTADILIAPAFGSSPAFKFLATPALEQNGRFSPDTKWIAYTSNESGRSEVYIRPFNGAPAAPTGVVQISNNGGEFPVWSASGKEIFYVAGDGNIFAVDTNNLGKSETVPVPARLFQTCPGTQIMRLPLTGAAYDYPYDTRDGQRFLVGCRAEPPGRFMVVMNWNFGN